MGSVARKVFWLMVLLLGIAATVYLAGQPAREAVHGENAGDHEAAAGPDYLVPHAMQEARAVEIVRRGTMHRFARDSEGRWYLDRHAPGDAHAHEPGHAHRIDGEAAGRIAKALAMLGRARVERVLAVGHIERQEFGVLHPPVIVLLYADGPRPVLTLEAGDVAPDGLGRYVHVVERQALVIVPDYHIGNLLDLLASFGIER